MRWRVDVDGVDAFNEYRYPLVSFELGKRSSDAERIWIEKRGRRARSVEMAQYLYYHFAPLSRIIT